MPAMRCDLDVSVPQAGVRLLSGRWRMMTAGIVWIGAIQFFIAQIIVQLQWTTPFRLADNYISDWVTRRAVCMRAQACTCARRGMR